MKLEELSDEELMLQVKGGNSKSFALLMNRYRRSLFNYLYRMTNNHHLSEDLFQETFLRIYKFSYRYEARASFSTYLYKIATNLAINELKRKKLRTMIPFFHESEEGLHEDVLVAKHMRDHAAPGPDQGLETDERIALVREGLGKLPEKHRAVLILSEFDELPYEEIAAIVGTNLGTVKSRIHRAKQNLKEWLMKHELFRD